MSMRILCLTTDAYSGRGGIALYNSDLIDALASYDDVTKIDVVPRNITDDPYSLPHKVKYVKAAAEGRLNYIREIARLVWRRPHYDLIICSHINLLPLAHIISKWLRSNIVLIIYGIDAWHKHHNRYVRRYVSNIGAVVSISEFTKRKFVSWSGYPEKLVHILPNAIHPDKYGIGVRNTELVNKYNIKNKKVLMTLGRLSSSERYKGIDQTLDILPELVRECRDIKYLVCGDGDDRQRLEQKAISLGISDYVEFTGYISEKEKADHYRLADVYVMPSKGEGFGFVFLEAMACGIPVIASIRDGGKEAVRNGLLGEVVDPDDPEMYMDKIKRLLSKKKSIPEGLEYFYFKNFRERLRKILISIGKLEV